MGDGSNWVCELCYLPIKYSNTRTGKLRILLHSLSHPFLTGRHLLRTELVKNLEDSVQPSKEEEES